MKKVLDEDIANNIIDLNIYKNKGNNVSILLPVIESQLIYFLINNFLEAFKMNRHLLLYTFPIYPIMIGKDIYNQIKDNRINFKLNKKKLKGKIDKLKEDGINLKASSLINASFIKDELVKNKYRSVYIVVNDKNFGTQIFKQESFIEDENITHQVFALDDEEIRDFLDSHAIYDLNDSKQRQMYRKSSLYSYKVSEKFQRIFGIQIIAAILAFGPTLKNSITNSFFDNERTDKIMDYFVNKDSLSSSELDDLTKYIYKQISKVSDDEKFNIENIETEDELKNYLLLNAIAQNDYANNEEKEVLYNFIDFFNDNPYMEYEVVYENLENLEFVRNYNPFGNGIDQGDGTVIDGYYYDGIIGYCTTPDDDLRRHEGAHAIFTTTSIPSTYVEGFAELIETEYSDSSDINYGAYNKNIAVTKATIDIIGKDKFLEAISTDDVSIIKDALEEAYINNNSYISEEAATLQVNNFFKLLESKLDDNGDTTEVANMLMSFFAYADYETYDYDKWLRLFKYASIVSEVKLDPDIHYYFNDEKAKTLIKN